MINLRIVPAQQLMTNIEVKPGKREMTIADELHDCVQDNLRYLDDKKSSHPNLAPAVKQSQIRRRRQPGLKAIEKLPVVDGPAWPHMAQLGLPRPHSSAGVFPSRNTEYLYALGLRVTEVCEF